MYLLKHNFIGKDIRVGSQVECTSDLVSGVHKVWDVGTKVILLEGMEDKIMDKTKFKLSYDLSIPMNFTHDEIAKYFSYIRVGGLNIHKYLDRIENGILKSGLNTPDKLKVLDGLSIFDTSCSFNSNNIKKKDKVFISFESIAQFAILGAEDKGLDTEFKLCKVGESQATTVKGSILSHGKAYIAGTLVDTKHTEFDTRYIVKVTCSEGNDYKLTVYPGSLYAMESYVPRQILRVGATVCIKGTDKVGKVTEIIKTSSKPYYVVSFKGVKKTETLSRRRLKIIENDKKVEKENSEVIF